MNNKHFKIAISFLLLTIGLSASCFAAKEKNIIKFARDINIEEGRTVRSVAAVIGNAMINGTAEDDVVVIGGSVYLGKKAYVGGNIVSVGGIIDKKKGSQVEGNLVEVNIPGFSETFGTLLKTKVTKFYWLLRLISIAGFLLLCLLGIAIIPKPIDVISAHLEKNTIHVISWSLKGLMLIVPLAVILTMSVAGIFLIPLEVVLVVAATLLGYVAVARVTGKLLSEAFKHPGRSTYFETALGVLIISIFGMIPILGWIVKSVAALMGFGGVLAALFDKNKNKQLFGEYFNSVDDKPKTSGQSSNPA